MKKKCEKIYLNINYLLLKYLKKLYMQKQNLIHVYFQVRIKHMLNKLFTCSLERKKNSIEHNEKDGGMYILPKCIASTKGE